MSRALQPKAQLLAWLMIFVSSTIVLALWVFARDRALSIRWEDKPLLLSRYVRTVWDTGLAFVLLGVMELLSSPAPDIVYKAF